MLEAYIPYGVTKINVKLWGGGGGSDHSLDLEYPSQAGGGGGYSSCTLDVPMNQEIYVIIAGGGGSDYSTPSLGGKMT